MKNQMTNALLYDFRRTLTSKSVIITVAVMVLISLAIIPAVSIVPSLIGGQPQPTVVGYYDSNGYHFIVYGTNQFGQGVSGYATDLNLTYSGKVYAGSGTTNSSGFASITVNAPPNPNYTLGLTVTYPGGTQTTGTGGYMPFLQYGKNGTTSVAAGEVVQIFGGGVIGTVPDSKNSSEADIRVFYTAPFGQTPANYAAYYKVINGTNGAVNVKSTLYNESEMQFLGTLTGYVTTFPPPTIPSGYTASSYFIFQLFYPNGTAIQTGGPQIIFASQLYAQQTPAIQTTNIVSQFFSSILSIFIPIVAIIGSYNSYGKDRVNGVLESVLSRPVTRRGLSISRFFSTYLAMAVAVAIAIAVIDGLVYYFGHTFVDATFLAAATAGFLVELAAFVGIMFFLSHLVKSSGVLIGIGIGLFLVLDFFWGLIALLIAEAIHVGPGSEVYYEISVAMQFANPAQFVSLVTTYLTNQSGFGPITPSQYGITIPSIVGAALLWIAIPFAIYLYLATHRD